ncbi:LCP family glycopolymer transferase [Lactiplantibacillus mudanjiangensis]|uniref:LytR family transcriptional regulator [Lactobacillus sp.] n=1 Tax=Lactiplantibacillus mudanjiangensis TaxID=1296538 RepID=A0A660DYW6_9LACO|nr:LCP family protein [Lactiplantibacillus mudanjiangensis]VDG18016.1 LytR family transcriptional regulator [Lactobacillus sp.] [Lactiplantibacillus mudanjiangensis]VDG24817.1 LytR family transcriptional regulator [Lactobacillus sp.] [Lactiplantibacillus mudanjiangensis]VDG28436.1 LytR family transcriptional regulator [Lactobacillus sp.] [Lactiplantibacillus mudanjiangensis]VDG32280.1 LytR family transcriptional regulator [Lactobacillus sp.] [Lactiplantibacillus mudanjiangensis]
MSQNNNEPMGPRERRRRQQNPHLRPHKHRPWLITLLILLAFGIAGAAAWGIKTWNTAKSTMNTTYQATGTSKERNVDAVIKKNKPFSILLLGTDTGALGRSAKTNFSARTDTMIVCTINPKKETMSLTSIPRDTLVTIDGQSEKINAAYTIGGASGAVKSVEKLLNVPIDFYVLINMGGLKQIVNAMGGVTVTPKLTFKYGHANVKKGVKIKLNGAAALDYSRMRYSDPLGDYGRQKRQRQIIMAMVSQSNSLGSIANIEKITKQLSNNMRTDLTWNDMVALDTKYKNATHHAKSYTLQGDDATIDGLSYQVASASERLKISKKIRTQLQLTTSDLTVSDYSETASVSTGSSSSSSSSDSTTDSTTTDTTQTTTADQTTTGQ